MIPSTKRAKLISGEKSSPEGLPLSPASEVKRAKLISGEKSSPTFYQEVQAFQDQYWNDWKDEFGFEDDDFAEEIEIRKALEEIRKEDESPQEIEISHRKPTHGIGKSLAALEELRKKNESSQEIEIRKPTHGVGKTLAALEELRKKNEVSQEISHHGVGKQMSLSALKKLLKNQSSSSQHDDHSSQASIHNRELLQQDNDPGKAEMDSEPEIIPEEQESVKLAHIFFYLREAEKRTGDALKLLREVNPRSLDKTSMECEMLAATENLKRASTLAKAHRTKRS